MTVATRQLIDHLDEPTYDQLRNRVPREGYRLTRSRVRIEREWGAGYRIVNSNNLIVAGSGGYGLCAQEVIDWCEAE